MFTKSTRLNTLLAISFVTIFGACGNTGGCAGCNMQPLPGGALPADQTVEGGGQIRVTQAGFQKLTAIVPGVLNSAFGNGFCVPQGNVDITVASADYCTTNQGVVTTPYNIPDACGNGNGCNVGIKIDSVTLGVTNSATLHMNVVVDVHAIAPLHGYVFGGSIGTCDMHVDGTNLTIDADISFDIDPTTGELGVHLAHVNSFDSSGLSLSNCGIISDLGNVINDILNSFVGDFVIQLLTPTLDNLVQGFLPHPLGIAGMIDVGALLQGVSPGTTAEMEARMVPGGYVQLNGGGMSLGLITGLNSDEDPSTRTPDLDSEPALCVPPIPAPDLSQAPWQLPQTSRGTFNLAPADEFLGSPEPANDLAIGISRTTLDLAGHHLVTSGAMCLGVGTRLIKQLNLGTFSLLVPSLAGLGDQSNPVLLVTRPQQALDFAIGTGTDTDPSITIGIHNFEVDVYPYIYERYVRAFTMKLDLNVGVNLTFDQQPGMPATVTPELIGLSPDNVTISVLNSEFVAETPQQLEAVLPTVFNLVSSLLGNGLGSITVPSFAGLTLNDLRVQKVTTSQDDFLAIYASLGSSAQLRALATEFPGITPALDAMDAQIQHPSLNAPVDVPTATVLAVDTPAPEDIRGALEHVAGKRLPSVTLQVAPRDPAGHELEYTWRLASENDEGDLQEGMWREFKTHADGKLVISDPTFAWQGKYTIELRSRVKDDYTTTSEIAKVPVIIDSVPPTIYDDKAAITDAGLTVPAEDLVSPVTALQYAWGRPGEPLPWTDFSSNATLDPETVKDLVVDGEIAVFVKDEVGNTSHHDVKVGFHGAGSGAGCNCDASGGSTTPSTGMLALLMASVAMFYRRRIRTSLRSLVRGRSLRRAAPYVKTFGIWIALCSVSAFLPACDCGGNPGVQACEVTADCMAQCPAGQVPFCLDHTCICTADVPYGRIGPYSDVAVDSQGNAWVSAYAESHGDLVVAKWPTDGRITNDAWQFVDGVPDGPVAIPGSSIRGGILEPGPDVGMYTSIGVAPDDTVDVTYYDVDNGSLKFAQKAPGGDTWAIHTIDTGTGKIDPTLGGKLIGMYTALTLRSDDGRPGVAYLAQVSDGGGIIRDEVRFAAAQTPTPTSAADWVFWTVDSETLPPPDPNKPDPTPLPGGLGLFVDATRDASQAPVLVYYDRLNGQLKMAKFDTTGGTFSTPVVLDGGPGNDVGYYPSVAVDAQGVIHVAYEGATHDDLMYIDTQTMAPQIVDDGYRIVGTTPDGLPKPEFHFVGDDSNIVLTPTGPVIIYMDSTTHELDYAALNSQNVWVRDTIAGNEDPFVGAFGFFASAVTSGNNVVISNWVIDQPHSDQWVQIFRQTFQVN